MDSLLVLGLGLIHILLILPAQAHDCSAYYSNRDADPATETSIPDTLAARKIAAQRYMKVVPMSKMLDELCCRV